MNNETGKNNLLLARHLVENLIHLGVKQFVISPGSRSTPLTLAVAQNKKANALVHYDERGAAFYALGHARATGQPAVLICTSGTAVANYFPALIESSMDRIPMIVLSADRPPELIDSGANQTIYQDNIFGDYTRNHCQLTPSYSDSIIENCLKKLHKAFHASIGKLPGPVHINCMFPEPLIPSQKEIESLPPIKINSNSSEKIPDNSVADNYNWQKIADKFNSNDNGLIIVARHQAKSDIRVIENLALHLNWPILPDITSGMRLGSDSTSHITHYDYLLDRAVISNADPLTILHFGAQPVSKKLTQLLAHPGHKAYVHVGQHLFNKEPYETVTDSIVLTTNEFCKKTLPLLKQKSTDSHPADGLSSVQSKVVADILDRELSTETPNEPFVARTISKNIIPDSSLFVASSRPIRDFDQFAVSDGPTVKFGCNRGASGIDGTIATAAGFASAHQQPLTIVIGDLALLHDLNSIPFLSELDAPVVLVVINNNGGGIFSFLPVNEHKQSFEKFFGTPHNLGFEATAKMFGCQYFCPTTSNQFIDQYIRAQKQKTVTIIEINTDRAENVVFHKKLYTKILDSIKTVGE